MRLTIVRQDYRPEGLVERVTERALEALLERNVAVSLYTRSWPQTRLQLVEPLVFDPFYVGAVWRDTRVEWPDGGAVFRDIFTGRIVDAGRGARDSGLLAAELFAQFPVALLIPS